MTGGLRILSIANQPPDPNSGAAGTVFHTNRALHELGHEVDEVWTHDLPRRRIAHGNLHSLLEQPRSYRKVALQRTRAKDYDVVQISQPQAWLAARDLRANGFPGVIVNRSHGVELRVAGISEYWHRRLGVAPSRSAMVTSVLRRLLARQWQGIARHCDGVLVGCELDRDFLHGRLQIPQARLLAAAHGVGEEFLQTPPPPMDAARQRRILHVGQFHFIKGSHLLPKIVDRVLAEDRQAEFTWVCSEREHARILALFHPASHARVHLLPPMPLAELTQVYDSHGIFLFPSFFEGFGKAFAEAMARGLCVVSSREGGMVDCIVDAREGMLCEVGDVDAFVLCTLHLLRTPEHAARMAAAGAQRARGLTWRACAEAATGFYGRLQALRAGVRPTGLQAARKVDA
jgi:glycosyltransferase involved in cell wall biosynthesis